MNLGKWWLRGKFKPWYFLPLLVGKGARLSGHPIGVSNQSKSGISCSPFDLALVFDLERTTYHRFLLHFHHALCGTAADADQHLVLTCLSLIWLIVFVLLPSSVGTRDRDCHLSEWPTAIPRGTSPARNCHKLGLASLTPF